MFLKLAIKIAVFSLLLTFPLIAFSKAPRQNEILVIGALKNLYNAQAAYFSTVGNQRFGTLEQLRAAGLIDENLARGEKFGYLFIIQTVAGIETRFKILARPRDYRKSGIKSFYFDASCTVRGGDKLGVDATVEDAIIESCTPTLAYENERQMIAVMRTLASAEETYRATVGAGNYNTFSALYDAGLISQELLDYYYNNYVFQASTTAAGSGIQPTFKIRSVPLPYGQMGFRSFYIDETGVLRGADHQGGQADENDLPVEN